jgi:heme exporter protein A
MLSSRGFSIDRLRVILGVLSAHNLSLVKNDRLLFDKVNFSLDAHGLLYVKGPNGAGKTSLLRALIGLHEIEQGEVHFLQENTLDCKTQFHQSLVYFGHKLGLNLRLSATENLDFWCKQQEQTCPIDTIYRVLTQLNLVGLEDIPVAHLSAGQQRRVALARFWLKDSASLWVLDEPFTALDSNGIDLLTEKILSFLSSGGAVVMTSHQELLFNYPKQELVLEYRI